MVIAVSTISVFENGGHEDLIYECFSRITKLYPQHTFVFISGRPLNPFVHLSGNIILLTVSPPPIALFAGTWYSHKLASALKKHRPDVLITSDMSFSFTSSIPQVLIVHDLNQRYNPVKRKGILTRFKKRLPGFLKKAKIIAVLSDSCKNDIIARYETDPSKIKVIYTGISETFMPVDFEEKQKIIEGWSGGHAYFLYPASGFDEKIVLNLLRAFSVFKKWQKSSMRLLIILNNAAKTEPYSANLHLFKYREEVQVLAIAGEPELAKLIAAAYVMVHTDNLEGFIVPPLQAMKSHTPVIAAGDRVLAEICGDAALYADRHSHKDLAEKMMMLFRDETLRQKLVDKGEQRANNFSWEKTSELLWESILKASL